MEGLKVLLVEDDPTIRKLVTETLSRWGFSVTAPDAFRDVMTDFAATAPHLVIMDVDLPSFDGYEWCARIRAVSRVPILFLTGLSSPGDQVRALATGADDWLSKPLDTDLLAAHVRALVRRTYSWNEACARVLSRAGLVYDLERRVAAKDGASVELGKNEARILETLLSRDGRIATRMELMDALWSEDAFVDDNTLTVNVTRLKKRLAEIGAGDLVETAKGEGYRIA
ncbi:MAG: response regulator transcription factor [Treponemataceae bacterium]